MIRALYLFSVAWVCWSLSPAHEITQKQEIHSGRAAVQSIGPPSNAMLKFTSVFQRCIFSSLKSPILDPATFSRTSGLNQELNPDPCLLWFGSAALNCVTYKLWRFLLNVHLFQCQCFFVQCQCFSFSWWMFFLCYVTARVWGRTCEHIPGYKRSRATSSFSPPESSIWRHMD